MMQEWTEIQIEIPVSYTDQASAIAQMAVPYGIYIEDYSDLLEEAPKIAHIDLIDEDLLQKDRTQAVIPLLIVATVWYLIITTVLTSAQYYVERYFARGTARVLPPTPLQRIGRWLKEKTHG